MIKISFAVGITTSVEDFNKITLSILEDNQKRLKIECKDKNSAWLCFYELLRLTYEKYGKKVVVLVDEYDKPIPLLTKFFLLKSKQMR